MAKAYLIAFMEGISLSFLAGFLADLSAFSRISSVKRRFMVVLLTTVPLSNKANLIFLLQLAGKRIIILFIR